MTFLLLVFFPALPENLWLLNRVSIKLSGAMERVWVGISSWVWNNYLFLLWFTGYSISMHCCFDEPCFYSSITEKTYGICITFELKHQISCFIVCFHRFKVCCRCAIWFILSSSLGHLMVPHCSIRLFGYFYTFIPIHYVILFLSRSHFCLGRCPLMSNNVYFMLEIFLQTFYPLSKMKIYIYLFFFCK
jgi:hypothetical protein